MASPKGVSWRRIGVNAVSLFGGDVLSKAGVLFVYVFVGRMLGVYQFGQLSLGMMLLYTFQVLSAAGLPVALTRWVARRPSYSTYLLYQGYLASAIPASLSVLAMCGLAVLVDYEQSTLEIITILSVAIPISAMTLVTDAVIKGREQMHLIPIGNLAGNLVLIGGTSLCLFLDFGVTSIACVVVISRFATLLSTYLLYRWHVPRCTQRFRSRGASLQLLRKSAVFFGTDGLQAISRSFFVLLLSKMASETEVGLLAAAFQLLQPIQMIFRSLGHSLFPPLINAAKKGEAAVTSLTRATLVFILRFAIPASLVMCCLSGEILQLVYGNEGFQRGILVLKILSFTLLFMPLNPVLGHALWAMKFERSVLSIASLNFVVRVIVGIVLISLYGLIGAAVSVLVCSIVNTAQHYLFYCKRISNLSLGKELQKLIPAVAAAIASVALLPVHRYASVPIALILYVALSLGPLLQFSRLTQLMRRST